MQENGAEKKEIVMNNNADTLIREEISRIEEGQARIAERICQLALGKGYDPNNVEPIEDGVVDIPAYVASKRKVMWVLKEAYDDWMEDGSPWGGGWRLFSDSEDKFRKNVQTRATFRKIAYASNIIVNDDYESYEAIPWLNEDPSLCDIIKR